MPPILVEAGWTAAGPDNNRACGTCYACCVWLGIEELKKYTGEKCKHLRSGAYPTKRCSIYHHRPTACQTYKCAWRAGWGPDHMQPNKSGILITIYDAREERSGFKADAMPAKYAAATVNVFDTEKAGPHIEEVLGNLLTLPSMDEVRLIFIKEKRGILFRDGKAYHCRLLPPEGFESLTFEALDEPMGTYYTAKQGEEIPIP